MNNFGQVDASLIPVKLCNLQNSRILGLESQTAGAGKCDNRLVRRAVTPKDSGLTRACTIPGLRDQKLPHPFAGYPGINS
eukprot:scaffold22713_cov139-Cylindrotheca_fusiformis.AAC.10